MVQSEIMDCSLLNYNGSSPISHVISDSDKTLAPSSSTFSEVAGTQIEEDRCLALSSHTETSDYNSVVSTNGGESSSSTSPVEDSLNDILVPVPVVPQEAVNEHTPAFQINGKAPDSEIVQNEHDHEPNGSLCDNPYGHYRHYCNCNRLFKPYCEFQSSWPGPCGPFCEYRFMQFGRPHHRWGGRWDHKEDEDEDHMPVGFARPDREIIPTGVGAGLYNLGNSCFLNAILQCFTHTVPLVKALRSCNHALPCHCGPEGFCVVCATRDHIELSLASSGKAISPWTFVDNLNYISSEFEKYRQEDAHEFLQCLLDKLERCCMDSNMSDEMSASQDNNIVERVFGGRLISKLRCCNCGQFSDKYEPLIDLSLEIEDVDTLESALDSFTKVEKIEDADTKFICDHCKEEVSVEKQLLLDNAPTVATLHLKRFKNNGSFIEKIDKHVSFPLDLDLKCYTNNSEGCSQNQVGLKYQLYSIVVHTGSSPTSGHYFCYVRSSPSTWHKLDDSRVVKVEKEAVLSQAAYILFYVRDGTPWFSSLIEAQKDSPDPSILSTSPKSVLDKMVTESATCPYLENLDHSKAIVSRTDVERTSNHSSCLTVVEEKQTNKSGNGAEGLSAHICNASRDSLPKLYCEESRDIPMNDVPLSSDDGHCLHKSFSGEESPFTCGNNYEQDGNGVEINNVDHSMPPGSSGSDLRSGRLPGERRRTRRDHLKMESLVDFKRLKKGTRDQRVEALRYINKNVHSSRGMKLVAAMLPQNDKKRRLRSSPCKQASPHGSCSKVAHPYAVFR